MLLPTCACTARKLSYNHYPHPSRGGFLVYDLKSNENIEKYGLLNHIEETDKEKNTAVYKQKAFDLLLSLNKETESISIDVLGDYKLQKGLFVPIEVEKLNLKAYYTINNSEHSIEGTTERVRLEIEKHQEID